MQMNPQFIYKQCQIDNMAPGSKVFTPYRAIGLVTNEIPLVVRYIRHRKENLIFTVTGNSFQAYGSNKFGLLSVGNPHKSRISCISGDPYHIYTACGSCVYAWRRTIELKHTYKHNEEIILLSTFGPHLITLDKLNVMRLWDIKAEELSLEVEFPQDTFKVTTISHPATYINKLLLGSEQGSMMLMNVKSNKVLYKFPGWKSKVRVIEQAPALDVMAIGLQNGKIILHNIKYDETIVEFEQNWGSVTSISFRTDGPAIMVCGSHQGHVAMWDLEEKKLASFIRDAHSKPITGLKCLQNEPLMVTSSGDNKLKQWIFDLPDKGARLLRIREGFSKPPIKIRHHGALGNSIITSGEDSTLRCFSTVSEVLHKNLGQASANRKSVKRKGLMKHTKKLSPIVSFTTETVQEKPWDNVVAIHRGKDFATTWSIQDQRMGKHKLVNERFKKIKHLKFSHASCLDISVCGNYFVIGFDSGHIDKYNIQSGIYKGTFGNPAHETSVCSVLCDGANQYIISGSQKGELKWWRFNTFEFMKQIKVTDGISSMILHRESGLLGLALENWTLEVVDIDTATVSRRLAGHSNQITDLTFSPNSEWIMSSALDKSIKTWDIPSSSCIDDFQVSVPASSISMSPTGDFLATIHSGHLGICLWANHSCFQQLNLFPLPQLFTPPLVSLPSIALDGSETARVEEELKKEETEAELDIYKSPEQISEELVTLALLPSSRWLNLLNLDIIRTRNKPSEPPKAPKAAPFFLPTVPGLEFKFKIDVRPSEDEASKLLNPMSVNEVLTPFGQKLEEGQLEGALEDLLGMSAAAVDVEIKSLDPNAGCSKNVVLAFLKMLQDAIAKRRHYEALQGYISLFLKVHADLLSSNTLLLEACESLLLQHNSAWDDLRDSIDESLCLVSYLKNAAIINY